MNKSFYFTIKQDRIILKNIDFKQCMGVLEGVYYCENPVLTQFNFKVDHLDLITKLDNFKKEVSFVIDPLQNILKFLLILALKVIIFQC